MMKRWLLFVLFACAHHEEKPQSHAAPLARKEYQAALPRPPGPFAPSFIDADGPLSGKDLADTKDCAGCHQDITAQWQSSAHGLASFNNPVYRVTVDRFRKEVGPTESQFCGGCHDIGLLVDGAMKAEVAPTDSRGHGGVTCRVCHNVAKTHPDGNASFTLTASEAVMPEEGKPDSVNAHRERFAMAPLRTSALCGSCHRAFLGEPTGNVAHILGQDDYGEWARSVYAGSLGARLDSEVETRECRQCHMPKEAAREDAAAKNGMVVSHRFLGANTLLAAIRKDKITERLAAEMLSKAATIDIAAVKHANGTWDLPADTGTVTPGESVLLDVVVRNQSVGHRFPGGVMDAQDVWIEVTVRDARGHVVANAGSDHEKTGDDPTAHRFAATQVGEDGIPLRTRETHRFRAAAYNHTLAPRDAAVVRYALDVPKDVALPLRITAILRHRTRNLALQKLVCEEQSSPRGKAFVAVLKERFGETLDACITPPVTTLAASELRLGITSAEANHRPASTDLGGRPPSTDAGGRPTSTDAGIRPQWLRLYEHGLGMLRALSEHVHEAEPSLTRALSWTTSPKEKAMVAALLAELAVREGRTEDAITWVKNARSLVGDHPALFRIEGDAYASVWRWDEAKFPYAALARTSPKDDSAWTKAAVAYGSAGAPKEALFAAKEALALQPRDQDCLRVQALALERLGEVGRPLADAKEAFVTFKTDDKTPGYRAACSKHVPGCAQERIPVHVHALRRPM